MQLSDNSITALTPWSPYRYPQGLKLPVEPLDMSKINVFATIGLTPTYCWAHEPPPLRFGAELKPPTRAASSLRHREELALRCSVDRPQRFALAVGSRESE